MELLLIAVDCGKLDLFQVNYSDPKQSCLVYNVTTLRTSNTAIL